MTVADLTEEAEVAWWDPPLSCLPAQGSRQGGSVNECCGPPGVRTFVTHRQNTGAGLEESRPLFPSLVRTKLIRFSVSLGIERERIGVANRVQKGIDACPRRRRHFDDRGERNSDRAASPFGPIRH